MITALIDADIVAYKAAAVHEEGIDWDGDGDKAWYPDDLDEATETVDRLIDESCNAVEATDVLVCLSDTRNFRKLVYPNYKSNRENVRRPELLDGIKCHLRASYPYYVRPWLEADDCLGILATDRTKGKSFVMVSEDKDLRTIPGKLYNPDHPERGIVTINQLDADRYLCWQTIVGDSVDGYPGLPGVGPKSEYAEDVCAAESLAEAWRIVVEAYESRGMDKSDALTQARCACILRTGQYNHKWNTIKLWRPPFF